MESDLVRRARDFAISAHRRIDQRRKYTSQPYEAHLRAVARLVEEVSDDPEIVAAAWLHDTVEDTEATFEDLGREFGPGVEALVEALTDISRPGDGNRARRKAIDREHLAAAPARAKTVKLADLIDNTRDITRHDPRFARTFLEEARLLLGVLRDGEPRLVTRLERELARATERLEPEEPLAPPEDDDEPDGWSSLADRHGRVVRLFATGFTSEDVAEPLRSFDADADGEAVARVLAEHEAEVAGVREAGRVTGFVETASLISGRLGDQARRFARDQIVHDTSPLPVVVEVLTRRDHCFVEVLGDVGAVVRRADMQKPIVRTWLFGIVSLMEMQLTQRIQQRWPHGEWTANLSRGRLEKARELREERRRRGQPTDLLSCLQISDKAEVLSGDPEERALLGFATSGSAKRVIADIASLRNNLAHATDIVSHDWPQIVRISRRLLRDRG
jgi:hypothetical protein